MSKRRVYVMDCGDFVKIGISCNTEIRKHQIPYEVRQYYCTKPIKNFNKIEKMAHNKFHCFRVSNAKGNEYFRVDFSKACEYIRTLTDEEFAKLVYSKREKELMKRLLLAITKLNYCSKNYILGLAEGLIIADQNLYLKQDIPAYFQQLYTNK